MRLKIKKFVLRIKPLYRILKYFKRRFQGINDNARGVAGKELEVLLKYAKKDGLFLEIGCAFGQTTRRLSEKGFVVGIDPYIVDERNQIMGEYFEDITNIFLKNILGRKVCYFPLKSEIGEIFWSKVSGKHFDFIFIDGLHTYEQVKKDYFWLKHLKKGGYIAFHDTNMGEIKKFISESPMKDLKLVDEQDSLKVFVK